MKRKTNAARKIDFYQNTKRGIAALEGVLRRSQEQLQQSQVQLGQIIEQASRERGALEAEVSALKADMENYKQRLVGLLSDQQREHARIAGCAEDEYAIQLIRLCRQKIDELSTLGGRQW